MKKKERLHAAKAIRRNKKGEKVGSNKWAKKTLVPRRRVQANDCRVEGRKNKEKKIRKKPGMPRCEIQGRENQMKGVLTAAPHYEHGGRKGKKAQIQGGGGGSRTRKGKPVKIAVEPEGE